MESEDGSKELPAEGFSMPMAMFKERMRELMRLDEANILYALDFLTAEERDRVADGEPYCFRCGKPASSFSAYWLEEPLGVTGAADYVRREEGTYNSDTNRFACDACYIAIGMPVSDGIHGGGWRAP